MEWASLQIMTLENASCPKTISDLFTGRGPSAIMLEDSCKVVWKLQEYHFRPVNSRSSALCGLIGKKN